MELQTGQVLELLDAGDRALGRMTLEDREGDLLLGRFAAGPDFPTVERLFRDFEEAAHAQALRAVDECAAAIAGLGLRVRAPNSESEAEVKDVQIWSDGNITFQLTSQMANNLNGSRQSAASTRKGT